MQVRVCKGVPGKARNRKIGVRRPDMQHTPPENWGFSSWAPTFCSRIFWLPAKVSASGENKPNSFVIRSRRQNSAINGISATNNCTTAQDVQFVMAGIRGVQYVRNGRNRHQPPKVPRTSRRRWPINDVTLFLDGYRPMPFFTSSCSRFFSGRRDFLVT